MSGNHERRLAKLEQELADLKKREELADCICRESIFVMTRDEFEVEMTRPCPSHGLRRLGQIIKIIGVNPDRTLCEKSIELEEAIRAYHERLLEAENLNLENEDDGQI